MFLNILLSYRWGEIEDINLIRDHDTGKSKGFGFLRYEDWLSTVLAVDNFNGMEVFYFLMIFIISFLEELFVLIIRKIIVLPKNKKKKRKIIPEVDPVPLVDIIINIINIINIIDVMIPNLLLDLLIVHLNHLEEEVLHLVNPEYHILLLKEMIRLIEEGGQYRILMKEEDPSQIHLLEIGLYLMVLLENDHSLHHRSLIHLSENDHSLHHRSLILLSENDHSLLHPNQTLLNVNIAVVLVINSLFSYNKHSA